MSSSGSQTRDDMPIAALSSAPGPGGVAVIRLSGTLCHSLLLPCLAFKHKPAHTKPSPAKMYLCDLIDRTSALDKSSDDAATIEIPEEIIDEPLVVFFYGPHSYTGQDSAEIHLHGGPYIVQRCLSLLYNIGFRAADPGEYTRRAFLNGKMDLTTAEGIKELAAAQSEQQWMAARSLATGLLAKKIESLRDTLMEAMAWLEASIDFPDEGETSSIQFDEISSRVSRVIDAARLLADTFDSGRVATSGLKVALFGAPNSGKSTLMNTLLGENRAIVTEVAGTTRDYLEEPCLLGGKLIRLIDTAGIRASKTSSPSTADGAMHDEIDQVEKIGIERSFEIARSADVVLFLYAKNCGPPKELDQWINLLGTKDHILVETKGDLEAKPLGNSGENTLTGPEGESSKAYSISCKSGRGVEALKQLICQRVDQTIGKIDHKALITSPRHKQAIKQALASLSQFEKVRASGGYEEMLAFELKEAATHLQSIIGDVESDDILGVIFSSFCVGK